MTREELLETLEKYIPNYILQDQKTKLKDIIITNFPKSTDPNLIYCNLEDVNYYYQGDGIKEIPHTIFNVEEKKFEILYFDSIILSNSCNINIENQRLEEVFVNFAQIIPLELYLTELRKNDIGEDRITSFLYELKNNSINNIFYLPQWVIDENEIIPESIIRLDRIHSLPATFIETDKYDKRYIPKGDRIFSFSLYGFYIFLVKLSIYFCRFGENLSRPLPAE